MLSMAAFWAPLGKSCRIREDIGRFPLRIRRHLFVLCQIHFETRAQICYGSLPQVKIVRH